MPFEKPEENTPEEKVEDIEAFASMEQVISPEILTAIAEASGGFTFVPDPRLPINRTGYTNLETKTIHYNPALLKGSPEHGVKPWRKVDIKGFAFHEAGHHAKPVVALQDKMRASIDAEIVPKDLRENPEISKKMLEAVGKHLQNVVADIWLESYMGMRGNVDIRKSITDFQSSKGDIPDYRVVGSRTQQFSQAILRSRYMELPDLEKRMDPDAFAAFQAAWQGGAMKRLMDAAAFENRFSSDNNRDRSINAKMEAYFHTLLPQYLNLLKKDIEDERNKNKKNEEGSGGTGDKGQGEENPQELSPEEIEAIEKLLNKLIEEGEKMSAQTATEEEKQAMEQKISSTAKEIEQMQAGQETSSEDHNPENTDPFETIEQRQRMAEMENRMQRHKLLAGEHNVSPEIIARWEEILKKYQKEISTMTEALASIFIDDRRIATEYLRREGDVVPGLEYETIAGVLSGDHDPDTKMRNVRKKDFLETEIEFIVDTSGSMSGQPLEKSTDMIVVITEAFKRVRNILKEQDMLEPAGEFPLRIGVTKFAQHASRITGLSEPIAEKKQIKILSALASAGGSTDESEALEGVYSELISSRPRTMKLMIVLTDGQGNRNAVRDMVQRIEQDDKIIFLAIGLGNDIQSAQGVVDSYVRNIRRKDSNVFGQAEPDVNNILPSVLNFLGREVKKRKHK